MFLTPALKSLKINGRKFLNRGSGNDAYRKVGKVITLKSTVVDALNGAAPDSLPRTSILRPGFVVQKKAADGLFYAPPDGDELAAPARTSSEAPSATWQNATITTTVTVDGQYSRTRIVTLGAADDTIAEVVAKLNADPLFAAIAEASDSGAADLLVITALEKGTGVHLTVASSLAAAYLANDNVAVAGTCADYRVLGLGGGDISDYVDMFDSNGVVRDTQASNLWAGVFDESQLIGLTDEAKAVFIARGSVFE